MLCGMLNGTKVEGFYTQINNKYYANRRNKGRKALFTKLH